jgi:uncharacterized membrane-anchored protein
MSTELRIDEGDAARLEAHRLSAAVLSEVHARPFTPIETPRRVLRLQTRSRACRWRRSAITSSAYSDIRRKARMMRASPVDVSLATTAFVPVAVGLIWSIVRRIRRRHADMVPIE